VRFVVRFEPYTQRNDRGCDKASSGVFGRAVVETPETSNSRHRTVV